MSRVLAVEIDDDALGRTLAHRRPGQTGANTLDWLVDLLDLRELPERLERLASGRLSAQPLIFHPFLHGERVPLWDADLRAAFLGLGAARMGPPISSPP